MAAMAVILVLTAWLGLGDGAADSARPWVRHAGWAVMILLWLIILATGGGLRLSRERPPGDERRGRARQSRIGAHARLLDRDGRCAGSLCRQLLARPRSARRPAPARQSQRSRPRSRATPGWSSASAGAGPRPLPAPRPGGSGRPWARFMSTRWMPQPGSGTPKMTTSPGIRSVRASAGSALTLTAR